MILVAVLANTTTEIFRGANKTSQMAKLVRPMGNAVYSPQVDSKSKVHRATEQAQAGPAYKSK